MSHARIPATQSSTTCELYWAAGFIEGEGSFIDSKSAVVTADQVTAEPLQRLHRIFGGSLKQFTSAKARASNRQPIWIWKATGTQGAAIAMTLYPLMSSRRQTAIRLMLDKWRTRTRRGQNMLAMNAARTSCKQGHPYTPENTKMVPYRNHGQPALMRRCLICYQAMLVRSNQRGYYQKHAEKRRAYARNRYYHKLDKSYVEKNTR